MRVRAKICGITQLADARAAVSAGCDALGFNFYRSSPRYVSVEQARSIVSALPPFVTAVGVFVDHDPAAVRDMATCAGVTLLQFHGAESDDDCAVAGLPFIKAIGASQPIDASELQRRFPRACGYMLDNGSVGPSGGTGRSFDWRWWPKACDKPLILAGGLNADNVAAAIALTRPYAVDVSSGVEGPIKGRKDAERINRFMYEVRRAESRD